MQIKEQELAQAVDRLREGDDNGLMVKYYKVLGRMVDESFGADLIYSLLEGGDASALFEEKFSEIARYELREAYRAKLEQEAGL